MTQQERIFIPKCPFNDVQYLERPCLRALNKMNYNFIKKIIKEKMSIINLARQFENKGYFPINICQLIINELNQQIEELKFECGKYIYNCEWYINDADSNYCFWMYVMRDENQKTHILEEIAKLTDSSTQNVKKAEEFALSKIEKEIKKKNLNLFFHHDEYSAIRETVDDFI